MKEEPDELGFDPEAAISVRGVCKRFRLGVIDRKSFRDELVYRWLRFRGEDPREKMGVIGDPRLGADGWFHALDGVSFDIRRGEAVGLIGRNGAGKSTMLKILARITEPDEGGAVIRGRVGSLLEVGTGFHPELTGRENVYLNGTILGMTKREIDAKFDEIVDFAEIGPFLDTPVKRYSSGMHVKLAFSVAVCLDTDVLLVDEVLAVGDLAFRRKSLERMKSLVKSGRTIVFVSHMIPQVKALCSRCIWFKDGRLFKEGPAADIADEYMASMNERTKPASAAKAGDWQETEETAPPKKAPPATAPKAPARSGAGPVRVKSVSVWFDSVRGGWNATLDYAVSTGASWSKPHAALLFRAEGTQSPCLFSCDTATRRCLPPVLPPKGSLTLRVDPETRFAKGRFTVEVRLWENGCTSDIFPNAVTFDVPEAAAALAGWRRQPSTPGLLNVAHEWAVSPEPVPAPSR